MRAMMRHFLHPEMDWRGLEEQGPVIMVRGEGCTVWDSAGNSYLDAQGGLCLVNIGYGRRELAAEAARQMEVLPYYHTYWRFANEPALQLAARVAELAPPDLEAVFFTPGGAEAVETAIKATRAYQRGRGETARHKIICFQNGYHGSTYGALSATGLAAHREPFGPLLPGFIHIDPPDRHRGAWGYDDEQAGEKYAALLEEAIAAEGPGSVAAFLAEPVPAVGGVTVPPEDYWRRVRGICDAHGVLLIADEVLTGWGRCGANWGLETYGVAPDIIATAKGMTSGYQPLGAAIVHRRIAEGLAAAGAFPHGHTYSGHPVACAVGLKAVQILLDERLPERARDLGDELLRLLRAQDNPYFGDVRGRGLLAGVALAHPGSGRPWPAGAQFKVESECLRRGVITGVCPYDPVVLLTPPLTIGHDDLALVAATLDQAVRAAAQSL